MADIGIAILDHDGTASGEIGASDLVDVVTNADEWVAVHCHSRLLYQAVEKGPFASLRLSASLRRTSKYASARRAYARLATEPF
jgi:hypothetical protein